MTASNEGIGYLLVSAGSAMRMGLAFAGLVVIGVMAMLMYELFSLLERRVTGWAHRGSQAGLATPCRASTPPPPPTVAQ